MSTLLSINHLHKSYGPRVIFDDAGVMVSEKQKIGVIGRNGAGKSTLFKIIVGDEDANSGEVTVHDTARLGYLTQHDPFTKEETVMAFLRRSSGKEDWQCAKLAGQFQLKNELLERPIGSLAGGYQMRVKLAALLLTDPNLLLLDEPTNYLDLSTQLLLEQFLRTYRGSFMLISHDREFLKNTCQETLEIDQGKMSLYPGPLEDYLDHKEQQLEMTLRYNKKISREKKHLQTFVDRFRASATKATQAQSKLKQIARLKTIDIVHPLSTAHIRIPPIEERKGVALHTNELTIGYGSTAIASNISLDIERGEHIAIVGDNGQGKTTFLKTIANELPALEGSFRWGPHISVGYYAQHVPNMLNQNEKVRAHLERVASPEIKSEAILEIAGNFLFHGDDVNKSIAMLSGGEKARLCLAGLILEKKPVLLLDEPTNHLDFETVEALALALQGHNGTIIFVSHNRTFVNIVATGIIEVGKGKIKRYHHNYEEYVYHLEQELEDQSEVEKTLPPAMIFSGAISEIKAAKKQLRRADKQLKKELQAVETIIKELETEKRKLLSWFEHHPTEYSREKTERLQELVELIEAQEKIWIEMSSGIV